LTKGILLFFYLKKKRKRGRERRMRKRKSLLKIVYHTLYVRGEAERL
jgi:hypothetical protein